jgi:hypothetical protein
MGMVAVIQADPACFSAGEVDHRRRRRTKGSWVTGRHKQREAQGRAAAWHAEVEEEKGKRGGGVRLSARGRRKEGGGPTAWLRVE